MRVVVGLLTGLSLGAFAAAAANEPAPAGNTVTHSAPAPTDAAAPTSGASTSAAGPASGASTPGASTPGSSTPASSAATSSNASPGPSPGGTEPSPSAQASQPTTTGQMAPASPTSLGPTSLGPTAPGQTSPGQTPPGSPPAAGTTSGAPPSKTSDLTPAEKDLLAQGYKLEMRGTEKHFCRSQAEIGTRFTHRVCVTAESVAATKRNSQDYLNDVQRPSGNTPGK